MKYQIEMSSRPFIISLGAAITAAFVSLFVYAIFLLTKLEHVASAPYDSITVSMLGVIGVAALIALGCVVMLAVMARALRAERLVVHDTLAGLEARVAARTAELEKALKAAEAGQLELVEVRSKLDEGATFTVDPPLQRVADAAVHQASAALRESAPAASGDAEFRVLVAEDNAVNQLVVRTLLHQIGVDLVLVENGAAAVEAWKADSFDAILMDIQMPEMDGMSATAAIRDIEAATGRPRTPIIALTANVMTHQVEQYRRVGMDDCVAKPVDLKTLCKALEDATGTRQGAISLPTA